MQVELSVLGFFVTVLTLCVVKDIPFFCPHCNHDYKLGNVKSFNSFCFFSDSLLCWQHDCSLTGCHAESSRNMRDYGYAFEVFPYYQKLLGKSEDSLLPQEESFLISQDSALLMSNWEIIPSFYLTPHPRA